MPDNWMIPEQPGAVQGIQMGPAPMMPNMCYAPAAPCIPQETFISNVKLARAYVPFQKLCTLLDPIEGLVKGTVFPELYSPYTPEDKCAKPLKYE